MDPYDSQRITLDPGLTALALRALHSRRESYPFVEPHTRWRAVSQRIRQGWRAWFPTFHALGRALRSAS